MRDIESQFYAFINGFQISTCAQLWLKLSETGINGICVGQHGKLTTNCQETWLVAHVLHGQARQLLHICNIHDELKDCWQLRHDHDREAFK